MCLVHCTVCTCVPNPPFLPPGRKCIETALTSGRFLTWILRLEPRLDQDHLGQSTKQNGTVSTCRASQSMAITSTFFFKEMWFR